MGSFSQGRAQRQRQLHRWPPLVEAVACKRRSPPASADLSLAGVRSVIADLALGLPVLRTLSLCTCRRQYPGVATGRTLRSTRPAVSAFPDMAVGSACALSFSRCYGAAARKLHPSSLM